MSYLEYMTIEDAIKEVKESMSEQNLMTQSALTTLISYIEKDRWIPCSERLPNRNEVWVGNDITDAEPRQFIVMVKGAYEPTTGYYTVDGWVKDVYDQENNLGYANEIVAWRFFPEPYKALN